MLEQKNDHETSRLTPEDKGLLVAGEHGPLVLGSRVLQIDRKIAEETIKRTVQVLEDLRNKKS